LSRGSVKKVHFEGQSLQKSVSGKALSDKGSQVNWIPPADLRGAFLDGPTNLKNAIFGAQQNGVVTIADIRWNGANLGVVDLAPLKILEAVSIHQESSVRIGAADES
jgi:hypothetical protein